MMVSIAMDCLRCEVYVSIVKCFEQRLAYKKQYKCVIRDSYYAFHDTVTTIFLLFVVGKRGHDLFGSRSFLPVRE